MSWGYGRLATEIYELDKPVGPGQPHVDLSRGMSRAVLAALAGLGPELC
jgi:hypothetical protein